ncbi:MAG: helix-turn-helix transcriptional regulator, partial [Clostridia bacterium]|nr:helix-turn-helix transcriptional regulator [Clostridia bacterium]
MEPIANILRTLRNERGYTQTEVAAALNLTSQAVSKWENGSGLPDVTQLVPLADFYGVTVDRLLGRKDHAAEQEVTDFIEKYRDILWFAQEYSKEHSVSLREAFDVGLDEGRAMMKKYPDDYRLKSHVCYMLDIAPKESDCDESYWNARNSELIDLAETILAECTDSRYRNRAIWQLAMTYPYQNRYDKVKELAELVPDMYGCKEAILCEASEYGTEENRIAYELHLKRSMMNVHFDLSMYYHNRKLPPEDILALTEMEWNIFHAYHDHGDFDTWRTCDLFENRMTAACAALILGQS